MYIIVLDYLIVLVDYIRVLTFSPFNSTYSPNYDNRYIKIKNIKESGAPEGAERSVIATRAIAPTGAGITP